MSDLAKRSKDNVDICDIFMIIIALLVVSIYVITIDLTVFKFPSRITEILLSGRKESNQTNKQKLFSKINFYRISLLSQSLERLNEAINEQNSF